MPADTMALPPSSFRPKNMYGKQRYAGDGGSPSQRVPLRLRRAVRSSAQQPRDTGDPQQGVKRTIQMPPMAGPGGVSRGLRNDEIPGGGAWFLWTEIPPDDGGCRGDRAENDSDRRLKSPVPRARAAVTAFSCLFQFRRLVDRCLARFARS